MTTNPLGAGSINGSPLGSPEVSVELTRHMDPSPFVVRESLPLDRTYRLFRTLGLRHLVVLRQGLIVAGIITRKDFAFGMAAPMREQGETVSLRYIRDSSLRQSNANAAAFTANKRGADLVATRAHARTI